VLTTLPFRVADAEYSNALDRIIALSGSPNRLNIYNAATGANTPVSLPLPGNAVGVTPNGLGAAVCHDGVVSIVNLQTATIEKSLSVSLNCHDIVYAGNGYVYLSQGGGWGTSSSVNVATGTETRADLLYTGINFRINPAGDAIYTSNTGTSGASVSRYSITGGPMQKQYESEWYPSQPFGQLVWFTREGRMVGDAGTVFRSGTTRETDFVYTGTLSGYGSGGFIRSVDHSTVRRQFASIGQSTSVTGTAPNDLNLYLHGDKYLALVSRVPLPKMSSGGVEANSRGKFLFWDSTGTRAYAIVQAEASAGFLNDFAVYTLSPEFSPGCAVTLGINSATAIAFPSSGNVAVNADATCVWEVTSNAPWIELDTGTLGAGTGNVSYSVLSNTTPAARTGTITIGAQTFTITQAAGSAAQQPLRFVPLPPCRVLETRAPYNFEGRSGAFGPPALNAGETRTMQLPASTVCSIPATAKAYVVNVTVIPTASLGYATVWPAGEARPDVWTIRSTDGQIVANSAIVKAGANGGISVYASDRTDALIDITGYYTDSTAVTGLAFYPLTPCRVIDTRLEYRAPAGPFGPPSMGAQQTRRFRFPASPYCTIPAAAAYSVTITAVPPAALAYLTAWPAGSGQPNVSSINSFAGRTLANNVIIPASADGSIDVFTFNATDFLIDINGYYAPDDGVNGQFYFPVTQCRASAATTYEDETRRTMHIPTAPGCTGIPANAKGYAINVTAMPNGNPMPFLTAFPTGQQRPNASMLNAFQGQVVTNAAIIPAGTNGAIDIFAYRRTEVVVEVSGYFGR
jgi:hypothetical protein